MKKTGYVWVHARLDKETAAWLASLCNQYEPRQSRSAMLRMAIRKTYQADELASRILSGEIAMTFNGPKILKFFRVGLKAEAGMFHEPALSVKGALCLLIQMIQNLAG